MDEPTLACWYQSLKKKSNMGAVARPPSQRSLGSASPGRRFVVLPHQEDPSKVFEAHKKRSKKKKKEGQPPLQSFSALIDSLTSMCLCHVPMDYQTKSVVIYPVAAFAYPLNHVQLVEQRRRENKHKMFRPVSEDDESISFKYQLPKRRKGSA
jgi:hypothetical protein